MKADVEAECEREWLALSDEGKRAHAELALKTGGPSFRRHMENAADVAGIAVIDLMIQTCDNAAREGMAKRGERGDA